MDFVTIRFATHWPYNPTSPLIAVMSGSRQWSHVIAMVGDTAYEATMLHGCRVVPLDVAMKGVAVYQDMPVPVADLAAAVAWGAAQDGKRYDYAGALGIPFLMSEDWADEGRWWCSELVFMMLIRGGTALLDLEECKRVTPNDLHQCNYLKSAIQQH